MTTTINKHIAFPAELLRLAEIKASRIGFNLAEYIRFLLATDVKTEVDTMPLVSQEIEKEIGQGIKNYKNKKYNLLSKKSEIKQFINKLKS